MQFYPISPEKSGLYSPLMLDYLRQSNQLKPFIQDFPLPEAYARQIELKSSHPINRKVLVESLRKQYAGLTLTPALEDHLQKLEKDNTYTITTGQQIHIFLGPLYVYWKIVSTIALCRKLEREQEKYHFVPVFWMATEDHDFEEINHLEIFNRQLVWEGRADYTGPVGHLDTEGLIPLLDELESLFENQPEWKEVGEAFRQAYSRKQSFAQATREVVNHFFGDFGLIIIDPDEASLKALFEEVMQRELMESPAETFVQETSRQLEQNYSRQLNPRPINLFYSQATSRERIEKRDGVFYTVSGQPLCDEASLPQFLRENLHRFSPNVVLRPLYQEIILPNLSYVGGPGELAYWMQLKGVFDHFEVPFPLLENRKSVFILGKKGKEQVEKTGLEVKDLFESESELLRLLSEMDGNHLISIETEINLIKNLREEILGKAASVQGFQIKSLSQYLNETEKVLRKIDKELYILQKSAQEKGLEKLIKLKKSLLDEHFTQERNQYLVQYFHKIALKELVEFLGRYYSETGAVSVLVID